MSCNDFNRGLDEIIRRCCDVKIALNVTRSIIKDNEDYIALQIKNAMLNYGGRLVFDEDLDRFDVTTITKLYKKRCKVANKYNPLIDKYGDVIKIC